MTTRIFQSFAGRMGSPVLGDVELPGNGLNIETHQSGTTHFSAGLVGLAVLALAIVTFLAWDFYRQKRDEKRERRRLERFREKKLSSAAQPSAVHREGDNPQA